jgi:hypothetical protein
VVFTSGTVRRETLPTELLIFSVPQFFFHVTTAYDPRPLAVPGCTFRKFHFHFLRVVRCLAARATARLAAFRAGERDEIHVRHCDRVSRHHGSPRPNRAATERPGK